MVERLNQLRRKGPYGKLAGNLPMSPVKTKFSVAEMGYMDNRGRDRNPIEQESPSVMRPLRRRSTAIEPQFDRVNRSDDESCFHHHSDSEDSGVGGLSDNDVNQDRASIAMKGETLVKKIEEILNGRRRRRKGSKKKDKEYFVSYKGLDDSYHEWVPWQRLRSQWELVEEYKERKGAS